MQHKSFDYEQHTILKFCNNIKYLNKYFSHIYFIVNSIINFSQMINIF